MADENTKLPETMEDLETLVADDTPPPPDKPLDEWTPEEIAEHVMNGNLRVPGGPVKLEHTFHQDNIEKFIDGDITFAELIGVSLQEAYDIAAYGYQLYTEAKYNDARLVFEAMVLANPNESYMHSMLGAVYQRLDFDEQAIGEYGFAIALEPNDVNARVNRAELLLKQGQFKEALDDLQKAVEADPEGEEPAGQRARALAAAAAEAFEKTAELLNKQQT